MCFQVTDIDNYFLSFLTPDTIKILFLLLNHWQVILTKTPYYDKLIDMCNHQL